MPQVRKRAPSRAEVIAEPGQCALPRVLGRVRVIGGALVAVEAVVGARIANDLMSDRGLLVERRSQAFDVLDRNSLVSVPEQSEPRALQRPGFDDERRELGESSGHDAA